MTAPGGRLLVKAAMRSADVGYLADQIQRLADGGIDALHFDVMDGRFVPELYLGPSLIRALRKCTTLPFEVHLLVEEPARCLDQYVDAGANTLLIHVEADPNPQATLARIRQQGCQAGLALRPDTAASAAAPSLDVCDVLNVMTVTPGQPGVLNERGVRTLADAASMIRAQGRGVLVQVDGAVSPATRARFLEAGARSLVAGYPIFSSQDFGRAIGELRRGTPVSTAEVGA